ncbi:MAG: hypothetical protein H7333_06615, partial [Bdellovibrionales bacterium]|nr:hypothetical protein [Oligoflexia bacterium]
GTCLDIYLVTRIILNSTLLSFTVTFFIFILYAWIWFIFPKIQGKKIERLPKHDA